MLPLNTCAWKVDCTLDRQRANHDDNKRTKYLTAIKPCPLMHARKKLISIQ